MGVKIVRYIPTFLWFCGILVASFMPSQHISSSLFLFPHQDKAVHFCMYFGLCFLFLVNSRHCCVLTTKFCFISALCVCAISGIIEILQPVVSNRSTDLFDFFANSLGAVIAAVIVRRLGEKEKSSK